MKSTDPFVTGQFYHLFNKTIDEFRPFSGDFYAVHIIDLAWYYRSANCKVSYSCYKDSPSDIKKQFEKDINNPDDFQVTIIAYCVMPNHYHLLLKQNRKWGIYKFMNNVMNAFTRYYNLVNLRKGPIFIPRYKSRLIHTEEQLIHVSRYIHLNPYSSGVAKSLDDVFHYKHSSLGDYINCERLVDRTPVMNSGYFLGNIDKYKAFIRNHADYQRSLEYIKHVKKWE